MRKEGERMLREEILEVLDLFDKYQIPEEKQREIFENGLYFNYTWGDPDPKHINQHLNFYGVGILLKTCLENNIIIDVDMLLDSPYMFQNEELIKEIALLQNCHDESARQLRKKIIVVDVQH